MEFIAISSFSYRKSNDKRGSQSIKATIVSQLKGSVLIQGIIVDCVSPYRLDLLRLTTW